MVLISQEFDRKHSCGRRTCESVTVNESKPNWMGLPAELYFKSCGRMPKVRFKPLPRDYRECGCPFLLIWLRARICEKRTLHIAYNNFAPIPQNIKVLDRRMIARPYYELANLLGYAKWADYVTANQDG